MSHIVVVGAGIVGLATARELALRGARVTVLERGMAAAGTSSRGEGNMLVSDKEIPAEAALALRSLQLWAAFAAESAEPFEFERKGGVIIAANDRQMVLLREQAQRQRGLGIASQVLDRTGVGALEPQLSPAAVGGVHYPQDAQVMPIQAVRALARAAGGLGVQIRTGVTVTGLTSSGTGVLVGTSAAPLTADAVVNAAGPWAGAVAGAMGGHAPVFPRRGWVLVTEPLPAGVVRHKVYDGRYVEAVASDEAAAQVAPVVESTASGTVLIGSSREAVGWDEQVPWDLAGRLARLAVELFPALAQVQVMRTYHGFRPATPDHLPLIGPDAVVPGLFHHTGHEGAGIGLALGSAELLADAVVEGRVVPDFDPRRFGATGSAGADDGAAARVVAPRVVAPRVVAPAVVASRVAALAPAGGRAVDLDETDEGSAAATVGAGPSAAMAWLSAGRQSWRRTRFQDRPRGLFCGIGHCHDCVVTDASGRAVRACLTAAEDLPAADGAR